MPRRPPADLDATDDESIPLEQLDADDPATDRESPTLHRTGPIPRHTTEELKIRARAAKPENVRLVELELRVDDLERFQLRTVGYDGGNGRLGKMDERMDAIEEDVEIRSAALHAAIRTESERAAEVVEGLRADLGTSDERKAEREDVATVRGVRRKLLAALSAAAIAVGGGGYAVIQSRDQDRDIAARARARLDYLEDGLDRLSCRLLGLCRPGTAAPLAPRTTP